MAHSTAVLDVRARRAFRFGGTRRRAGRPDGAVHLRVRRGHRATTRRSRSTTAPARRSTSRAAATASRCSSTAAATAGLTIDLTGTVAAGDVYVAGAGAASRADPRPGRPDQRLPAGSTATTPSSCARAPPSSTSIGQIGFDPGTEWGTRPHHHGRQHPAPQGICRGRRHRRINAFDPAVEWDGFATDTFDGLGAHPATRCHARRRSHRRRRPPRPTAATGRAADANVIGHLQRAGRRRRASVRPLLLGRAAPRPSRSPAARRPSPSTRRPTSRSATRARSRCMAARRLRRDANDPPDTMVADFAVALLDPRRRPVRRRPSRRSRPSRAAAPRAAMTGARDHPGRRRRRLRGRVARPARLLPPGRRRRRQPRHLRRHLRLQRQRATAVELGDVVTVTGTRRRVPGPDADPAPPRSPSAAPARSPRPTSTLPGRLPRPSSSASRACSCELPQDADGHRALPARPLRPGRPVVRAAGSSSRPTSSRPAPRRSRSQAANDLQPDHRRRRDAGQNPDPILFGRGGDPLIGDQHAARRRHGHRRRRRDDLHLGAATPRAATPTGVRPLGRPRRRRADFDAGQPAAGERPARSAARLAVVGMNLLNFFNTFGRLLQSVSGWRDGLPRRQQRDGVRAPVAQDRCCAVRHATPTSSASWRSRTTATARAAPCSSSSTGSTTPTAPGTWAFIDVDAAHRPGQRPR